MTRVKTTTSCSPATTRAIPTASQTNVLRQLAALQSANTAELKQRWRELFDTDPPQFSRTFLQNRLAYRIQEVAYGGLQPETSPGLKPWARGLTAATSCYGASGQTTVR